MRSEITTSHLNNQICQHRGMKTSTVTPSFYYVFNISLYCYDTIPNFIGNLWRVLLPGNHLKQGIKKSEFCLKQGRKISAICLKQGQGMRGRAAPPHPEIYRVPPPPPRWIRTGIGGRSFINCFVTAYIYSQGQS